VKVSIIIFLLIIAGALFSQDIEVGGFIDTYHAAGISGSNDFSTSITRFRGKIETYSEDIMMNTTFNIINNNIYAKETKIELREAYIDYSGNNWDLRAGRQIVTWGKADGFRITDNICPSDLTEFITRDFEDIRIPIDILKIRWLPGYADFEMIWIPFYSKSILPASSSSWYINMFPENSNVESAQFPEKNVRNSEVAGKISMFLSKIDIAFSGFYTWNDFQVFEKYDDQGILKFYPKVTRQTILGFEYSSTLGQFVLRGEYAAYLDEYQEIKTTGQLQKNTTWNLLNGIDWSPGNDWTLSFQEFSKYIYDHNKELWNDKLENVLTFNISKKFLNQTLEIASMSFYNLDDQDLYEQFNVTYSLSDELQIECGFDLFKGEEGKFGVYNDNSQIRLKLKYSF